MSQGELEWFQDRLGKATASKFGDVMAFSKRDGRPLKARGDYLMKLVSERLSQEIRETSHGAAGRWGTENEPYARLAYEAETGIIVRESGFISHKVLAAGCSPDGLIDEDGGHLIDEDGGQEIKCPFDSAVHLQTIITQQMPEEHIPQVQGGMWITARKWWDFVSFDPRMPENLRLYIQRIHRDEKYISDLEKNVAGFLCDVDAVEKQLREKAA